MYVYGRKLRVHYALHVTYVQDLSLIKVFVFQGEYTYYLCNYNEINYVYRS